MYPFRRILVPTDFSTASEWIFDDAIRLAGTSGAEIVILHIRMTWEAHPSELRLPADASLYEYAEKQELDRLRERIARANAKVATRLVVKIAPDPGKAICETAAEEKADLLVIATHARHHVAHLIIGSTTLSVINDPPAPVLAIRYGIRKRTSLKTMLVPVHLQQKSHASLELAAQIAAGEGAVIHLVTVCDDSDRPGAQALLQKLTAEVHGAVAKSEILRGTDVPREIIRYAERVNADVIVLNADQQISDTKGDIVRKAPVPVLVVPSS